MYYIQKSFEISASHHLTLSYESKCTNVHGHNWHETVYCKSKTLNCDGMVADFSEIKRVICKSPWIKVDMVALFLPQDVAQL